MLRKSADANRAARHGHTRYVMSIVVFGALVIRSCWASR